MVFVPPQSARQAVVPVIVDRSRSMRLNDANGQPRFGRAVSLLKGELLPELSKRFTPELYGAGERLEEIALDGAQADRAKSDLRGALEAVRERYRGQPWRASCCCPTAAIPVVTAGSAVHGAARVRRRTRIAGRPRRSGSRRDHGGRSAAGSGVDRSARHGGQRGFRPGAVSAARAGERHGAREPPHRAAGGRRADRGGVHRLAGPGEPDGLHRGDSGRRVRVDRREQQRAACWSIPPAAAGGSS